MRARNIKPGFYRDADLVDCSIRARYIAPGLWMMADREGRLKDNPKQIKMELCPCDDIDIDAALTELATALHIIRYEAQGVKVIQIRKFIEHQNPHKNEPASTLPERDRALDTLREDSSNGPSTPADSLIPDSLKPDSLNPERKEKEKKRKKQKGETGPGNPEPENPVQAPDSKEPFPEKPKSDKPPDPKDTPEYQAYTQTIQPLWNQVLRLYPKFNLPLFLGNHVPHRGNEAAHYKAMEHVAKRLIERAEKGFEIKIPYEYAEATYTAEIQNYNARAEEETTREFEGGNLAGIFQHMGLNMARGSP